MLPEIASEELAAALNLCVVEVLDSQRIGGPPVDAIRLAAGLGMDVAWDAAQPGRGRIVKLHSAVPSSVQRAVLLRPEPRPERIQWAVAHEIGEELAHRVFAEIGIDPREAPPHTREQVANQLAVRLLLPEDWFAAEGTECLWDLPALKQRFVTVSHELIARRMLDFPGAMVISIYDQGKLKFRRAANGRRADTPRLTETDCWHEVHETGQTVRRNDAHSVVRGWPIHEPDWKREILRLDWNDDVSEF